MATQELSLVIGTAGHIDHGKTSLVRALSGVDCDRLTEEKRRGITIELGFAPLTLPSGRIISLIDVPGHEKFIRQMVAGASGLDAVVLVVAADEGVMPQTREHLDILQLLGVRKGLVVLTKKDLVDEDMLAMAIEDVAELARGTFLESSPVIAVSSSTGEGIEKLRKELEHLVDQVTPRERHGALFQPIDRTFAVPGFGTVITGTAYKGSVRKGDEVDIWPSGLKSRVRSVQVHGSSVEEAQAGQRVALCLSDISLNELSHGDVVCSAGVYKATQCIDVNLTLLKTAPEALTHWQRVRLHLGTADVLARVALLSGRGLEPGETAPLQLVLEEPVAASLGQRFVIRFYSPLQTIGGGEVLDPYSIKPTGRKRREQINERLSFLQNATDRLDRIIKVQDTMGQIPLVELVVRVQERREDLVPLLEDLEGQGKLFFLKVGSGMVVSLARMTELTETLRSTLKSYHQQFPHHKGIAIDELVKNHFVEADRRFGRALVERLVEMKRLRIVDSMAYLPGFTPQDNDAFGADREKLLTLCRSLGYQFPSLSDLPSLLNKTESEIKQLLDQMKKMGDLAILDGTFVLSRELEEHLVKELQTVEGGVSLAQVREITASSRKFMVPVMEYLDGKGVTRRIGDKRIVLKK